MPISKEEHEELCQQVLAHYNMGKELHSYPMLIAARCLAHGIDGRKTIPWGKNSREDNILRGFGESLLTPLADVPKEEIAGRRVSTSAIVNVINFRQEGYSIYSLEYVVQEAFDIGLENGNPIKLVEHRTIAKFPIRIHSSAKHTFQSVMLAYRRATMFAVQDLHRDLGG